MKIIILLTTISLSVYSHSYSQLKVTNNGRVGIGTNAPIDRLHVQGRIYLTGGNNQFRIVPDNPGTEIGTTTDVVEFWHSVNGYHVLKAQSYSQMSDARYKSNMIPIKNPLEKILTLKPYKYDFKSLGLNEEGDTIIDMIPQYGFIAQEVEKDLPEVEIVQEGKEEIKLMEYNQIIPIAVAAIQEQQLIIDLLKKQIESLMQGNTKSLLIPENNSPNESANCSLFQNYPNPFNERTTIEYFIDSKNYNSAFILIFDMNGLLLKQIPILSAGKGKITIEGSKLNAGMYIYSLVVNQKEIDSKRMILLK